MVHQVEREMKEIILPLRSLMVPLLQTLCLERAWETRNRSYLSAGTFIQKEIKVNGPAKHQEV